ncbi:MAG: ROK family protein [Candidatus Omnitrophica bacterium]|jgi:glucokinase|nr:ROK family protein [Candidatus Omnitrophota bacterium]MDD3987524.1 ROK family protein [Candidatus Omnitrophota bacterium]MDD4981975.1 ROK family protein [Candidatus Omnitrophota bacterium]MDD5665395.1 ROK family protein [Candidatus Omnitrophota bacterium]
MNKRYIIGIDLGGTNLKVALLDLKYNIKDREVLGTRSFLEKEELISGIVYSINRIIKYNGLDKTDILGVGLGLPGPVDTRQGVVHFLPNVPGWKEVRLRDILKKRIGLAVFLDNDAKVMALAEHRLGAARGFNNVLCMTLGTGIGGGIIIGGKLYRGFNNAAGEVGHLPINERGLSCNCGRSGCLEAYIGNSRILNSARKEFKRDISLEELSLLAAKGNRQAIKIWRNVGKRLGFALAGVVNILNLDAVVMGGGVSNAGRVLFDSAKESLQNQAMSVQGGHVKIFRAKLGNNAGLIGAAIMVREGQAS